MLRQYNEKPFEVDLKIFQGADFNIQLMARVGDGTGNVNIFDMNEYDDIKCHLKYRLGTGGLIDIQPSVELAGKNIKLSISETQTNSLRSGRLYFNVLATKDNITTQIFLGSLIVEKGVTSAL